MRLWENKRQVYTGSLELVYHYFNLDFDYQMAKLLILGDSQIERVWNNVRGNREMLRSALYFPVKNRNSLLAGFQAIKPTVSWIYPNLLGLNSMMRFFKWSVSQVYLLWMHYILTVWPCMSQPYSFSQYLRITILFYDLLTLLWSLVISGSFCHMLQNTISFLFFYRFRSSFSQS